MFLVINLYEYFKTSRNCSVHIYSITKKNHLTKDIIVALSLLYRKVSGSQY
jgi:hypothetical protein